MIRPRRWARSGEKSGRRISSPTFIAREAIRTSGMKTSLFLNFSPTADIPTTKPSSRIFSGRCPWERAFRVSSLTLAESPASTLAAISVRVRLAFPCLLLYNLARKRSQELYQNEDGENHSRGPVQIPGRRVPAEDGTSPHRGRPRG